MLLPADRILNALVETFAKLMPQLPDANTDASPAQGVANALRLLANRESGGLTAMTQQLDALEALLRELGEPGSRLLAAARAETNLARAELAWQKLLEEVQQTIKRKAGAKMLTPDMRGAIIAWEAADRQAAVAEPAAGTGLDESMSQERLTAYLQDRFAEPDMALSSYRALAGGFGKETYLFTVAGSGLSGPHVMRRDMQGGASLAMGCHRVRAEYEVIRAVSKRQFPGPNALWLDTVHTLLPGGDFIIMTQSPGVIGGNFFGAQNDIPDTLVDSLGDIMARLHTLPPLTELGELTGSINTALWSKTRTDCTANYIAGWRDYFLANHHTPSPALMALYAWLFDNLPTRPQPPTLIHCDIGFHNFLFDDGKLSTVLDWEFAHIGDPAEDLGCVAETVGPGVDFEALMARYVAAGGEPVDSETLRFFRIWVHVRNATGANLITANFVAGLFDDLKLAYLPHVHYPMFLQRAQALIEGA